MLFCRSASVLGRPRQIDPYRIETDVAIDSRAEFSEFDGGGRGRPRSDRRGSVCLGKVVLFDGGGRGRPRSDRRAFVC